MYPTRIVLRPANGHKVAKAAPSLCRGMSSSFFPPAPFWSAASRHSLSPYATSHSDLSPLFRMLDETSRAFDNFPSFLNAESQTQRIWQPRFDVQEVENAYQLRGELPGVEGKDLDVQFSDATTLVVRGQTQSSRTEGQPPKAVTGTEADVTTNAENTVAADAEVDKSDAGSVHSDSSYVRPSVEDDVPETASTLTGGNNATPAESTASAAAASEAAEQADASAKPNSTYWLSERRTGSFQRTFSFPQRIDQDGVTASLKNGILEINVPKAAVPSPRRVAVQ